ncbi:MAG: glycine--tRNA ligase subunit beta [Chromatiaceae bacterium]
MVETRDLLVEIGTEELPPTALHRLSQSFAEGLKGQLAQHHLGYGAVETFATPRRLALLVRNLEAAQPDQELVRHGPSLRAAFDGMGQPTPAAMGFARSCGVEISAVEQEETDKGTWLVVRQRQAGRATRDLLVSMVERSLASLPIPKRMRWGDRDEEFVRPVHWVVLLFGDEQVEGQVLGVMIGRETYGHRFHRPGAMLLWVPGDYADLLRETGRVEPDFNLRREHIRQQVQALAVEAGGYVVMHDELLDEVTALCEWPSAILGGFDPKYLEVPAEVLIETMQKNQKYFPLRSADGSLLPKFITIANIESLDPGEVRKGNERVIRPRFADAAFFWSQDLKHPLEFYGERLNTLIFQDKLGTVAEKSQRVAQIARYIAGIMGYDEDLAARAAHLAKCDLMTSMIFEFGGLQGIMGRYYAEHAGENPAICAAMEEQYLPRHAGDRLPVTDCGRILSLAEKLDTLVGIFAIGQRPTGVKDPYALRRAAIGILRLLIETPLDLDLRELLDFTAQEFRNKLDATAASGEVFDYVLERLKGYCQDHGLAADQVDAVQAVGVRVPSDIYRRILAVRDFSQLPEALALTAANKRIRNILKKSEEKPGDHVDQTLLVEPEEISLAARIRELGPQVRSLIEIGNYADTMRILAGLRPEVDAFFDQVMVMAEDPRVRANRLALLAGLESLFLGVADIARLQPMGQ